MGMFDDIPTGGGGGMFDDIEAPKSHGVMGTAKDIGLSAGTGAVHGAESFLGLPGDAANLLAKGSKIAGDYVGGLFGEEPSPDVDSHILPTSGDIRAKQEAMTGPLHAPETTYGKYGESIGEVLGNPGTYFGPGGWLAKTLQGAASGAGAEAMGEATGDNPLARFAGSVLAGPLAGRLVNPQMGSAAAQRMAQRGMTEMTPGQLFGLTGAEEKAESIPVLGSMVKKAQGRSFEDFNRTTGNQVLAPIGESVTKGTPAGHDLLDHVHDKLDSRYDQLVPNLHFVPDRQWANDLATIDRDASFSLPRDTLDHFRNIVDNRLSPNRWVRQINPNGTAFNGLQGPQFKQIESELTHLASQYGSSSDAAQRIMGQHLSRVVSAMRSNLERSNPAQAQELKNLNTAWAMYTRMRTAAANRVTTGGIFSPGDLLSAIKRGDKSVGKGMFARGDALMQKYATDAQQVLGKKIPNSASADRAAFMAAPGLATWLGKKFIEHPLAGTAAAAATAAGMGAYSGPGQRALNAIARPATGLRGNYAAASRGNDALIKSLLTTPYGSDETPYGQ
jgi:hypothetical protein